MSFLSLLGGALRLPQETLQVEREAAPGIPVQTDVVSIPAHSWTKFKLCALQ